MSTPKKQPERARSLRQQVVPAQALVWGVLRNRGLGGFKFRRQHQVGPFFVDFACHECRLVVELDGESHLDAKVSDERRTAFLAKQRWKVIRFWNTEVFDELEVVQEAIYRECVARAKAT